MKHTAAGSVLLPAFGSAVGAPVAGMPAPPAPSGDARWLDGVPPSSFSGAAWGMPWPMGRVARDEALAVTSGGGVPVPAQSWVLATWPDGSLKWSGHAVGAEAAGADAFRVAPGVATAPPSPVTVSDDGGGWVMANGVVSVRIPKSGDAVVSEISRSGRVVSGRGTLVCVVEERPEAGLRRDRVYTGRIDAVTVEQTGPVRGLVRIEGRHVDADRSWLPFVVRLSLHSGAESLRVMHTLVFDGDPSRDFIRGLGLRMEVPLAGRELHDRHVRIAGSGGGIFAEAVRGLTGLRRDPGAAVRLAQIEGRAVPPQASWDPRVPPRLAYVPAFGDWTLVQGGPDGFEVRKRTGEGFTWLSAARGTRSDGLVWLGGPGGGLAVGIRNFWESHPAQIDLRGAAGDVASVTAWLWAPDAPPMDLRPYHDGMGQDTFEKQYNGGLEITYEDYEPGFDSPEGVARTSELQLWALGDTPGRARFAAMAAELRRPPRPVATVAALAASGTFGRSWTPADRSTPARAALEDALDGYFDFYEGQREQRRWYGFWNFGDVMHTYDPDRREWRYDVGGYAWDNSELSTDIWLWLHFLRTGCARAFRFAEAMTRHTGEVDVHHLGRFAPLGSRHNVLHWGCSAKQLRISTALNRRYFYYLTADERTGDLMREQVEAVRSLATIPPGRKLSAAAEPGDLARRDPGDGLRVGVGFGTDWSAVAGAWLTEWERTGDGAIRDRLLAGMRTIGAQPRGFFTGGSVMNVETGAFERASSDAVAVSHLSAVFGLVEVCAELVALVDDAGFRKAWVDYCELYNAPADVQSARLGGPLGSVNLQQGHARLTAFAARERRDAALAERAWREFFAGKGGFGRKRGPAVRRAAAPDVLRPVDEDPEISTNAAAQWGLAAIQCLAWAPEGLEPAAREGR